ncbi:MAG: hypothetical protein A2147_08820 [Chloroflexi bacterium RBG_16_57_8]|nr:MAG: hypothetical protein A2147_08820 [Chloroflexi bacterium RBG_16_57_8]
MNKTRRIRTACGLAFLMAVLLVSSGCQVERQPGETTSPPDAHTGFVKGVGLSPRSQQPEDFTTFFETARQAGSVVMWAGDWIELARSDKGGPVVVTELASRYDYTPLVEVQFFTQSTGALLRPLDAYAQTYKNSLASFVEKYKPAYLGIGIEVNVLYERAMLSSYAPNDFERFVELYREAYTLVKAKSPNTRVFTVFQLEKMKGLNGGLFGGVNSSDLAQWLLLDVFPTDIVAFTTYPGLIYRSPDEIPQDYYTEIRQHTTKPVAFTEIGWHTASSPRGWESSEAEQAEFVKTFFRLTETLDKELVLWSFLYDQDTFQPFDSMGLWSKDGPREAWAEWQKVK